MRNGPQGVGACWACCEEPIGNPGCVDGDEYQEQNDDQWQAYYEDLERSSDNLDISSIDSEDWCEHHCHCGYGDGVYSYCMQGGGRR